MMMVIVVRGLVIHIERQYTNAIGIWQARKYFRIHMFKRALSLAWLARQMRNIRLRQGVHPVQTAHG
jgi:hypothetical protein